ncbi:MAG: FAD-binding oxidoreductase, partial [Proteobacteria bacterium]|nr:FAD-binding oxidoreductase [Pseudomonadota bacterium]
MASTPASVLVIGGGVIGLASALALQQRGCRVTILDARTGMAPPSWGNAGHIATEQVEPLASPATLRSALRRHRVFGGPLDFRQPWRHTGWIARYLRACTPAHFVGGRDALRALLADALPAWRRLADTLPAPRLLREDGHWVCWESQAATRAGLEAWNAADTGTATFSELDAAQRQRLQARLTAPVAGAIAFAGTAQVADPGLLLDALATRFGENGGTFRRVEVESVHGDRTRCTASTRDGERIDADALLVCAGVHSRALMAGLGVHAPLIAERGYHLQWAEHDWPDLPPVVFEQRSMIVSRFSSGLRAAGFVEYADIATPPDPRKWQRLRVHVQELGLPVRGEPVPWFGARPTLPDYLPAIGRHPRHDRLFYAFGHQHLGLTLGAIT